VFRRAAIKGLLNGRLSADEGLKFFAWFESEYQAGRATIEEFGEFIVSLDQALIRENHPLRPYDQTDPRARELRRPQ
jgi:hypothetical protein